MNKMKSLEVKEQLVRKFERIYTEIYADAEDASLVIAREIAEKIKEKANQTCVLGLATGSSPIRVYKELVRMHKEEGLSFKNVVTFNLDEYYPMTADNIQSYVYFMNYHLFNHIDIPRENINIPDGSLEASQVYDFCQRYEEKIVKYGGIDIQILGIGRTGHVGFNEPGSGINSPTRMIALDSITMRDASGDFGALDNVPGRAITMGVQTIMSARKIFLMAWGEKKATIIKQTIEGEPCESIPATFLQHHPDTTFMLDKAAAGALTREKLPWLVKECVWNEQMIRKACLWLSTYLNKPILKLTNRDYNDNNLSGLLAQSSGKAYDINLSVFNALQKSITGWPGGKLHQGEGLHPERAKPYPKKVLVFSPHPDDDVFSMGGTLRRLVEQGHEVHVAYQTSGNFSVKDDYVLKYMNFLNAFMQDKIEPGFTAQALEEIWSFIGNKTVGEADCELVRYVKSLIRREEAKAACRYMGIGVENIHFLQMPFYETGHMKKKELNEKDYQIVKQIMEELKPDQIFAAGDLTDPNGTHRKSFEAITGSLKELSQHEWLENCGLWLYKGSFQEWDLAEVDMAVPLSPDEMETKRQAIFKHETQKEVLFPGEEEIEIWKHAQERNLNTANKYHKLGMANYEAMEVFVKMDFR